MDPKELKENPKNWRKHPSAQAAGLDGVLTEVGWITSVILNERTGHLVDGHLRVELALRNGESSVPVVVVDLSQEEEDAILASFDPISAMAKTNHEALAALIAGITSTNPAVKDLIDRIKRQTNISSPMKGDDTAAARGESDVHLGDVFVLGDHRLMCGDSTDPEDVKILLAGASIDEMITDPPYGVDYGSVEEMRHDGKGIREGIKNDESLEKARMVWDYAFKNAYANMADGAPVYVFGPQGINLFSLAESVMAAEFEIHQQIVWNKNRFVFGRSDYKYKHEMILYGWKKGVHPWYGGGNEVSIWDCDSPQKSELHPTQKPVALYERAIINSSEIGEAIYDPFAGSGTLIAACEAKKRKGYAMELDPVFCASIISRWEQQTGKKAVKEGNYGFAADNTFEM
jgi:DNA modification methylase